MGGVKHLENERLEALIAERVGDFQSKRVNCAEAVLTVMGEYYGWPKVYPRIATAFGGGILRRQAICGALSGGLMAIGMALGREVGGDRAPCDEMGNRLLDFAEQSCGSISCLGISGADFRDPIQDAAFRSAGGAHECVCEPLVASVCRWLANALGDAPGA